MTRGGVWLGRGSYLHDVMYQRAVHRRPLRAVEDGGNLGVGAGELARRVENGRRAAPAALALLNHAHAIKLVAIRRSDDPCAAMLALELIREESVKRERE